MDIVPGTVTSVSPFLVKLTADQDGQPCQRLAPGTLGTRGAVLVVGGGTRLWLGPYDDAGTDLGDLTTRVANLETTVNTSDSRNTLLRSDISALQGTVNTGPNRNTLLRSDLNSLASRVSALEAGMTWTSFSPESGYTAGSYLEYGISANGTKALRGNLSKNSGSFGSSFEVVADLPSEAGGIAGNYSAMFDSPGGQPGTIAINSSGTLSARAFAAGCARLWLNGIVYF